MADISEKEKYLLKALLYLLLYSGMGEKIEETSSTFTSSKNPITDYGRTKILMAG